MHTVASSPLPPSVALRHPWALACLLLTLLLPVPAAAHDGGTLHARGDRDFPPYEYLDHGKPTGFNVDLLRAVCETMGLDVTIELGPWDEVRAQLERGGIDALTGMYESAERDRLVDFTSPHSVVFQSLFAREGTDIRGFDNLAGRTVVVERGDLMHEYVAKHLPGAIILTVGTQADALRSVASGAGDVALVASLPGHYNIERFGLDNLVEVGHPMEPRRYCFAVPEGREDLRAKLDEGLAILRQTGRYDRIHEKWFARFEERSALRRALRYVAMALAPLLLVLLLTLAWTWTLRRTVGARTRELAESEERYRSIFENIMDGYYQTDMEGRLLLVNPAGLRMFGYASLDEMPTGKAQDVYPDPGIRERFMAQLLAQGRIQGYVNEVRRKDGEYIFMEANARLLTGPSGEPTGVEGVFREVTGYIRSQEALRRAKEQAEAASRSKSEFLANMSHELRTPLNGAMGMLQLLAMSDNLSQDEQGYVGTALRAGRNLTILLSDILDLSRVEAGRMRLSREPFALGEILEDIVGTFADVAASAGLSLELERDPALPARLMGDPVRLRQVLFNLVGNAVKFTREGGIRVFAQPLPSPGPGRCRLLFTVQDTGIGIPEKAMALVFEPFTQVDPSYTRAYQGAGLGLRIVKRLVELMGGGLTLDSQEGQGTTACCSLPFELPEGRDEPRHVLPEPVEVSLAGMRVLLAEDDPSSALAVRLMLEREGARVLTVGNGREALDLLTGKDFDVVLMDVQMPVMDGVDAVRLLRTDPVFRDRGKVPVVALTAHAMEGDRERFLEAGMDAYLAKPVDHADLVAMLRRALRPR